MMTAVLAGVMFLWAIGWSWGELTKLPIPTPRWNLGLSQVEGTPAIGQTVTLAKQGINGQPGDAVGSGTVESYAPSARNPTLILANVVASKGENLRDAKVVTAAGVPLTATIARADGIPVFRLLYVQGAVALLIAALGVTLIYSLVGRKLQTVEFLIATDSEMKKVNWGTRKVIIDSTYVVIAATFIIAGIIFAADALLGKFFQLIHVLGGGQPDAGA